MPSVGAIPITVKADNKEQHAQWKVGDMTAGRVSLQYSGARTDAVYTLKGSVDGTNFAAFATTATLTTDGDISRLLDLVGYTVLRAELTTPETGTADLKATLTFFGQ